MIRVAIACQRVRTRLTRPWLRRLVQTVLRGEGVAEADIGIAVVNDATIAAIHRRFFDDPSATDVISFPLSDTADGGPLAGEIVVSVETAAREAKRRGHPGKAEVALYVIHGLLHLCGYEDRTKKGRSRFRERERHYLARLAIRLKGERDW
jgi:probable rRNA maturation factor